MRNTNRTAPGAEHIIVRYDGNGGVPTEQTLDGPDSFIETDGLCLHLHLTRRHIVSVPWARVYKVDRFLKPRIGHAFVPAAAGYGPLCAMCNRDQADHDLETG